MKPKFPILVTLKYMKPKFPILVTLKYMKPKFPILVLGLGVLSLATTLAETPSKPNVLLLIADDLAVRLSCYGDSVAKTPGIDRLAAEGVLFERAYAQGVVCTPSRKSFLTGLSTKITGSGSTNYVKAHPETMTVSRWFRQHGYQAIGIGKVEHTMDFIDPEGWDVREDSMAGDNRGKVCTDIKDSESDLRPFGIMHVRPDNASTKDMANGERMREFLQKRDYNKPFFAAMGFHTPHLPYDTQQRFIAMHPPGQMPLSKAPLTATAPLPNSLPFKPINPTEEKQQQVIQGYYAAVSMMDGIVSKFMEQLRTEGVLDNTIVIFLSDQGYHLGYRGLWCKHTLYPGTVQVPLIIRYPKAAIPGARTTGIVELLDLFSTLTELAGLPACPGLQGQSFAPLLKNPRAEGKPAAFAEDGRLDGHAVYTKEWAYIERSKGAESELYNLGKDPECYRNVAKDPAMASIVKQHQKLVREYYPEIKK